MFCEIDRFANMAEIDLSYALAEVVGPRYREAIERALEHTSRAEAYLKIVLAELDDAQDATEAA